MIHDYFIGYTEVRSQQLLIGWETALVQKTAAKNQLMSCHLALTHLPSDRLCCATSIVYCLQQDSCIVIQSGTPIVEIQGHTNLSPCGSEVNTVMGNAAFLPLLQAPGWCSSEVRASGNSQPATQHRHLGGQHHIKLKIRSYNTSATLILIALTPRLQCVNKHHDYSIQQHFVYNACSRVLDKPRSNNYHECKCDEPVVQFTKIHILGVWGTRLCIRLHGMGVLASDCHVM